MLFECVRELLLNVVKHAATDRAVIELKEAQPNVLRATVCDEGKGFNLALLDRDQANNHYGLFHIRQRIEGVGGRLEIDSRPSVGTRVTLICPVDSVPESQRDGAAPAGRPGARRDARDTIAVLIVDDHNMFREGIRTMLELEDGFEVVGEAADGREAIRLAQERRPDVVVMDVKMPEMDGVAATRRLRRELPDVPVIGLTMHEESVITERMDEAGAVLVLHKSAESTDLCAAIRQVADGASKAE
jgi:CheY-like chemotaxis protein